MSKPHIRLHFTATGYWWAERYLDCKHGWNVTARIFSPREALEQMAEGRVVNRRGWLAQWPNQCRTLPGNGGSTP